MLDVELLQKVFSDDIPITNAIGLRVVSVTNNSLSLSAPLEKNHNDKNTAFAGSLYSVAVLAGWGFLQMALKNAGLDGQVVIQESGIKYYQPVTDDIVAKCSADFETDMEKFLQLFRRKDRARIRLVVQIHQGEQLAVEFEGQYVAYQ